MKVRITILSGVANCDTNRLLLAFGGSWADTDVDLASISVPIEKPYGHHDGYSRGGGYHENSSLGPPYIVKLVNLPVTANDAFVQDLFQSRFTSFVKFKILTDPSSNILETHIIRQVAFVELESAQDAAKTLKWHDLYYKGNRRVIVEVADFNDFHHCIQFNQEHHQEIQQIQHDFIAQKQQQKQPRHMALLDDLDQERGRGSGFRQHQPPSHFRSHHGGGMPLSPERHHASLHNRQPSFDSQFPAHKPFHGLANDNAPPLHQPPLNQQGPVQSMPHQASKPKANPFGGAKPVDTVSRQQEIEKS